jgi:hypothetical protein
LQVQGDQQLEEEEEAEQNGPIEITDDVEHAA